MGQKIYKVIIQDNGNREYFLNEKRHRVNGPAVEYAGGTKHWYFEGKRHRTDGTAIEEAGGSKYYYFEDKLVTKSAFRKLEAPAIDYSNKIVEIDGKRYKLTIIIDDSKF